MFLFTITNLAIIGECIDRQGIKGSPMTEDTTHKASPVPYKSMMSAMVMQSVSYSANLNLRLIHYDHQSTYYD